MHTHFTSSCFQFDTVRGNQLAFCPTRPHIDRGMQKIAPNSISVKRPSSCRAGSYEHVSGAHLLTPTELDFAGHPRSHSLSWYETARTPNDPIRLILGEMSSRDVDVAQQMGFTVRYVIGKIEHRPAHLPTDLAVLSIEPADDQVFFAASVFRSVLRN